MADWSTLSAPQIRCIDALDFAVPLHWSHMHSRYKVRGSTIESCIRLGLVRREFMRAEYDFNAVAMSFLSLTQLGLAYQRDWRRWNAAVERKLGGDFLMTPPKRYDAQVVLERIATVATAFAAQAGVGAMETAGGVLGYLAANPRDLEPFMNGGIWELPPPDWLYRHDLTWHAQNGKIVHPAEARRGNIISQLKKSRGGAA